MKYIFSRTTLARWRAAQVQEAGGQRERRPYLASECTDLQQAEKWRLQIVREIAKKVAQIQNGKFCDKHIKYMKVTGTIIKINRFVIFKNLQNLFGYDGYKEIVF